MNFEKRLEDARARRQIVLEQKDRAARAVKAAAERTPEPAKSSASNLGDAQDIPRARPAGTNARALEAALAKQIIDTPPSSDAVCAPLPQSSETDTSENVGNNVGRVEVAGPVAANTDIAYSEPPKARKSLSGRRAVFVGIAILGGFGLGIFAGPLIVARLQGLVTPPSTAVVQDSAPQQPSGAQVAVSPLPSEFGGTGVLALDRAAPQRLALNVVQPALPLMSPAPAEVPEPIADASTRIPNARPQPRATQTALTISPGGAVDSEATDILLSTAPRVASTPGTQILALLDSPDELPSLPLRLSTPNIPIASPRTLSPVKGDTGASVDAAQAPPAAVLPSPRLTGIGSLESYRVHVQWSGSLSSDNLADVEAVIDQAGLPLGKLNRVGYKISFNQVRYFHRRDAVASAALAARIGARARDFTNFRPSPAVGTLEVFLSGSAITRRTATQDRSPPGQLDREFIELRDRLVESLRRGDHL